MDDNSAALGRGIGRLKKVLRRRWKAFLAGNLVTVLSLVPFGMGVYFAIGTSSLLILGAACVLGGLIAGPVISCLVDLIFRSLRGSWDDWKYCYGRAMRQDARCSLFPGVVFCLIVGSVLYLGLLMLSVEDSGSVGALATLAVSFAISTVVFLLFWPQLVLFDMRNSVRLKNMLLFLKRYFWRVLGVAAVNVLWWGVGVLLLPWSLLLLPVLGLWFIWLLSFHLLYDQFNSSYNLEQQIFAKYPEQRSEMM